MSAPTLAPIKVGDTLSLACTYKVAGIPTDVTGYSITAQLRDSANLLILDFVVVKAVQSGGTLGMFKMDTSGPTPAPPLPVDLLRCDIQFVLISDSTVRSSETFYLPVEEQVTT